MIRKIITYFFSSYRCLWSVRRATYRKSTRKIPVRLRRVLSESVPKPTYPLRKAATATTFSADREFPGDRAAILREASRQDPNRDPHQGHATLRELVLVALHGDHVTHNVAAAGGGMIHALRLPAVPAEPALRPVPKVPARGATA